jgi:hypothetical protein
MPADLAHQADSHSLARATLPAQEAGERHPTGGHPVPFVLDPISFVLAGEVDSWDSTARVLYIGHIRLEVAANVLGERPPETALQRRDDELLVDGVMLT